MEKNALPPIKNYSSDVITRNGVSKTQIPLSKIVFAQRIKCMSQSCPLFIFIKLNYKNATAGQ